MSTVQRAALVRTLKSTRPPALELISVENPSMLESGLTSQFVVPASVFSQATALTTGVVHGVAARAGVGSVTSPTKASANARTTAAPRRRPAGRDGVDSGTSRVEK